MIQKASGTDTTNNEKHSPGTLEIDEAEVIESAQFQTAKQEALSYARDNEERQKIRSQYENAAY